MGSNIRKAVYNKKHNIDSTTNNNTRYGAGLPSLRYILLRFCAGCAAAARYMPRAAAQLLSTFGTKDQRAHQRPTMPIFGHFTSGLMFLDDIDCCALHFFFDTAIVIIIISLRTSDYFHGFFFAINRCNFYSI